MYNGRHCETWNGLNWPVQRVDQFSSPSLKFQFGSLTMTGFQVHTDTSCPACLAAAAISCNGTNLYHGMLDIDVGL